MKILIVEDDPVSRRLLEAFLCKWGYQVQVTTDGSEAWDEIQKPEAPSLVISDWMMPNMDGLELCSRIRKRKESGYTYFIILTAKGRKEDLIKGLEAGADDFLIKPFDRKEMKYRIRIGERIIKLEQRILKVATTDDLTGILNRRAFTERVNQEINRSRREKTPLSFILSDIDHFKYVNDRHGHQAGDLVLQKFVNQLTSSSRPYDVVGRYGGEEFTICLPGADASGARLFAERFRKGVENMKIMLPDCSQSIQITASFGTTSLLLESEEGVDSLIKRADDALYKAKNEGRNRVCTAG
jgi:two-component system chemotaxis response regulator CheY